MICLSTWPEHSVLSENVLASPDKQNPRPIFIWHKSRALLKSFLEDFT